MGKIQVERHKIKVQKIQVGGAGYRVLGACWGCTREEDRVN